MNTNNNTNTNINHIQTNNKDIKILILGAGISGISTYKYLKEHDYEPIILEARDR